MRKDNARQILVVGSLAYDHLMHYEGLFQDRFIPTELHALSVSFGVSDQKEFFGGCGGNITRHLRKLGENPILVGLLGNDFDPYEQQLKKENIDTRYLIKIPGKHTAAAYIVTDDKNHQIAFFSEGAQNVFKKKEIKMLEKHLEHVSFNLAILSPTNPLLIEKTGDICAKRDIPYFLDPGQVIPQFEKSVLQKLIMNAFGVLVNEYEMSLLCKHLKCSPRDIKKLCPLVCETLGEKGSLISYRGTSFKISPCLVKIRRDPTGAGDAYRAGFLHEIMNTEKSLTDLDGQYIKRAGVSGSQFASKFLSTN